MTIKREYLYSELTDRIIAIAIKVHKILGPGFVERIYEKALAHEFSKAKLNYVQQKIIRVNYDNILLGDQRIDFMVEDKVIIELKTVVEISEIHLAQMISYLKTDNKKIGLILNFAKPKLEVKRIANKA